MRNFRGKDVMTPKELRRQLIALNAEALDVPTVDGRTPPGRFGVAIFAYIDAYGATDARVQCTDSLCHDGWQGEPVVWIPGFGHPFPVKAFVEALLVSEVETRP